MNEILPHMKYYRDIRVCNAIDLMVAELQRAEEKHPVWPDDNLRRVSIVAGEAGESLQAALHLAEGRGNLDAVIEEIVQTGAMCIRMLINMENIQ